MISAAVAATLPTGAFAQLEEVLVTAERREASVQDVPIAVSAYNEDMIDKLQIDDTLDLINVVPNMFGGSREAEVEKSFTIPLSAQRESLDTLTAMIDGLTHLRTELYLEMNVGQGVGGTA